MNLAKIAGGFTKNKILLIRSCECKGRLSGCLTGWLDSPLSEYGLRQSQYLSLNLFKNLEKQVNQVFASDMLRAKQSLEICFSYKESSVRISQILRDIHYGDSEGLFYDGLPKDKKKELACGDYIFPLGESYLDVKYRAAQFLQSNITLMADKQNIIFTHNIILQSLLKSGGHDMALLNLTSLQPNNKSNSVLQEYKNAQYKKPIESVNMRKEWELKLNSIIDEYTRVECTFSIPDLDNENTDN